MKPALQEQGLVDLVVSDESRLAARVLAIGHGHVLLRLFGHTPETVDGAAALEVIDEDAVDRIEGRLRPGGDPFTLIFEPLATDVLPQRRGRPRFPHDRPVLVERGGTAVAGRVVDLSPTGLRFRSEETYLPGETVMGRPRRGARGRPRRARHRRRRVRARVPRLAAVEARVLQVMLATAKR